MLTDQRKKEIFSEINKRLQNGERRKQVFDAYNDEFKDSSILAQKITRYLDPRLKEQFKWQNRCLIGLVIYAGIIRSLAALSILHSINSQPSLLIATLLASLIPALALTYAYFLWRRIPLMYAITGWGTTSGFFSWLSRKDAAADWKFALINSAACLIVISLSFYLAKKLYPYSALWGGAKKDSKGNYEFLGANK